MLKMLSDFQIIFSQFKFVLAGQKTITFFGRKTKARNCHHNVHDASHKHICHCSKKWYYVYYYIFKENFYMQFESHPHDCIMMDCSRETIYGEPDHNLCSLLYYKTAIRYCHYNVGCLPGESRARRLRCRTDLWRNPGLTAGNRDLPYNAARFPCPTMAIDWVLSSILPTKLQSNHRIMHMPWAIRICWKLVEFLWSYWNV